MTKAPPTYQLRHWPCRGRSRKIGSSLAEFGPVLIILVLVIILPLVNLIAFVAGYAAVASITQACATEAANSASFDEALVNLKKKALSLTDSGLGKLARVKACGGYENCGVDLYIATTNLNGNLNGNQSSTGNDEVATKGHFYGPNTGLPAPAASDGPAANNSTIYEYTVRSNFTVGPFMDLSHIPFVGDIPLVGKGVLLSPSTSRVIEHCDALSLTNLH